MEVVLPVVAALACLIAESAGASAVDFGGSVPIDSHESLLLPEQYETAQFMDGSFDTLVVVRAADGSSRLGLADDASPPLLGTEGTPQIKETVVDGPLLDVLLTVNGFDHSLLALNRMDASLLGVSHDAPHCDGRACRETCSLHKCPGGYCDRQRRCRCFMAARQET